MSNELISIRAHGKTVLLEGRCINAEMRIQGRFECQFIRNDLRPVVLAFGLAQELAPFQHTDIVGVPTGCLPKIRVSDVVISVPRRLVIRKIPSKVAAQYKNPAKEQDAIHMQPNEGVEKVPASRNPRSFGVRLPLPRWRSSNTGHSERSFFSLVQGKCA